MLNTTYKLEDIYDYDRGLTLRQIEFIGRGIIEQEHNDLARDVDLWSLIGPFVTTAVGVGMGGDKTGTILKQSLNGLRQIARQLRNETIEEREPSKAEVNARIMTELTQHPMFEANVPGLMKRR